MTSASQAMPRVPVSGLRIAIAMLVIVGVTVMVAALPEWTGLASIVWPALILVCYRFPVFGLALLAFTIPLQDGIWIETIVGHSTTTRYVGWSVIAAWLPMVAMGARVVIDRVAVMHALVVITLVTSFGAGGVRVYSWFIEIYHWLLPLVIYIVCRSLYLSVRDRMWIVTGIAVGVTVASIAAIRQLVTGAGPESYQVGGAVRVFGTFGHPNTLAAFLVIALPMMIAVSVLWTGRKPAVAIWTIRLGSLIGTVALILTQSRGGWLAFAGALAVLLILAPRYVQRIAAIGALLVVVVGIGSGLATEVPGVERFSSVVNSQFNRVQVTTETWGQLERQAHWGAALSMLREDPVYGVGAAEYNDNFREHTTEWRFRVGRGQAHNGYLHMGAQAGVPGLLAFVAWIGTILVALARRVHASAGPSLVLAAGGAATVIAYIVDSVFEYLEVLSLPVLLAIVVAIALGAHDQGANEQRIADTQRMAGNAS